MRFRVALPITELLLIAVLCGIVATCWLGWQVVGPNDGPQAFASPQFKVIGNQLFQNGKLIGTWVPPREGRPGFWKSLDSDIPDEIPAD